MNNFTFDQFQSRYQEAVQVRFAIFSQLGEMPEHPSLEEHRLGDPLFSDANLTNWESFNAAEADYEIAYAQYRYKEKLYEEMNWAATWFIKAFNVGDFQQCLSHWNFPSFSQINLQNLKVA